MAPEHDLVPGDGYEMALRQRALASKHASAHHEKRQAAAYNHSPNRTARRHGDIRQPGSGSQRF